jgi:dihydrofolate reductase
MGILRFHISMSLDGYVAGPRQTLDDPLGEGGERLHEWFVRLKFFKEMQGLPEGGDTGLDDDVAREAFQNIGATVMGRNMFGGGRGPWPEPAWNGWWGDDPPYHTDVFVLTHHARDPLKMLGGTTFYFVTDGIESALRQAKESAGDRDVMLAGGAAVAQQYLAAGLVDEMELHVAPILLGAGERLLDNVGDLKLEPLRVLEGTGVAHLKYRVGS